MASAHDRDQNMYRIYDPDSNRYRRAPTNDKVICLALDSITLVSSYWTFMGTDDCVVRLDHQHCGLIVQSRQITSGFNYHALRYSTL